MFLLTIHLDDLHIPGGVLLETKERTAQAPKSAVAIFAGSTKAMGA